MIFNKNKLINALNRIDALTACGDEKERIKEGKDYDLLFDFLTEKFNKTKLPKNKIHPAETKDTYRLATTGVACIIDYLNELKGREPLDGDETEAVALRLRFILDENEGNLDKKQLRNNHY